MNEEMKFKYDKNDKVLFVNRDHWIIDCVTVVERAETQMFPAYYVRLESGHITMLPEEWLFADKKDAVATIIRCLKERKEMYQEVVNNLQGKIDDFQSANFQMRYMGETLKTGKKEFSAAPWSVNIHGEEYEEIGVKDQYGQDICECWHNSPFPSHGHPGIDGDQQEANAYLIAAAPEMYEALVELVYNNCHQCIFNSFSGSEIPSPKEFAAMGCIKTESAMPNCKGRRWHLILKKARVDE